MKIINKLGFTKELKNILENEIEIHYCVKYPIKPKLKKVIEDGNYIYLIFDNFEGEDLYTITTQTKLQEKSLATICYHVIKGLRAIHNLGYFHGYLNL